MTDTPLAAIILAAGKGTRMKSALHKVLHPVAGRPMLGHLTDAVAAIGAAQTVIVAGAGREQVEAFAKPLGLAVAVQSEQLGTAHAVQQAQTALAGFEGDVLILYGDVPLVTAETMTRMVARLHEADAPAVVVLGFRPAETLTYGRIIAEHGRILKMVEHKDASTTERAEGLCNSGLMAVRSADLWRLLDQVDNTNAAGEFYLPDIVMLANGEGRVSAVIETDPHEVAGINSRAELAEVEALWQQKKRARAMADGVSLIAPETVWFAWDTQLGRDVTVGQNVIFGPGTSISDEVTIHPFCHIEGARVEKGAIIGPYARLRPGADIGAAAHVGNFVEIKKARLGEGTKANHLTYIGDAEIGARTNIGAGTITCNYDGFGKYLTRIGANAFIGSNSALVAPVSIGDGAIIGAGSVVTSDVPADALAVARGTQQNREGWAARFREGKKKS
jgi:bifunctional UDP-N-acetylglucosamine pyrophosphorylase/glucosamine-1-phosphate N-acetyltransferase